MLFSKQSRWRRRWLMREVGARGDRWWALDIMCQTTARSGWRTLYSFWQRRDVLLSCCALSRWLSGSTCWWPLLQVLFGLRMAWSHRYVQFRALLFSCIFRGTLPLHDVLFLLSDLICDFSFDLRRAAASLLNMSPIFVMFFHREPILLSTERAFNLVSAA